MEIITEYVFPHWPFIVATLIFATMGQVMKATVFTKANVVKYKASDSKLGRIVGELLWWGRKSLPMHPVIAGALLGGVPGIPVSAPMGEVATAVKQLYYAGAGMASTWAFAILKSVAKKRGIELDMPRESTVPPAT